MVGDTEVSAIGAKGARIITVAQIRCFKSSPFERIGMSTALILLAELLQLNTC